SRDNLSIGLTNGVSSADLNAGLRLLRETPHIQSTEYTSRQMPKFAECLPPSLASIPHEARERWRGPLSVLAGAGLWLVFGVLLGGSAWWAGVSAGGACECACCARRAD